MSVVAEEGIIPYVYTWYSSSNNADWTTIDNASDASYTATGITSKTYYKCVVAGVDNSGCATAEEVITVDVYGEMDGGVIDGTQAICYNTTATAFVNTTSATGGAANGYQWQSSADGGNTWSDIADATSETYSAGAWTATTSYRRAYTGTCGTAYSNEIIVTVNALPTVAIIEGTQLAICDGNSMNITATGATSYEWSTTETTDQITISTADTYTVIGTDDNGCQNTASTVLTVNDNTTLILATTANPVAQQDAYALCAGDDITIYTTVTSANGSTVSYTWYNGENVIANATESSLTLNDVTAVNAGEYTVVVVDDQTTACQTTSAPLTLTVHELPV